MHTLKRELPGTNSSILNADGVQAIETSNYSELLDKYGLDHKRNDIYELVGRVNQIQGWILHVSVVRSQICALLIRLIPILAHEGVPFKIAPDKNTARNILDGNLGLEKVGKVICIYPPTDAQAKYLAKKLVIVTKEFKGPQILTDVYLGGTLYTQYCSNDPVTTGQESIPFTMPAGVEWPFSDIASPHPPPPSRLFIEKYKMVSLLKLDAKGSVIKALYLHHLLLLKWCVIKEGKKDMWSDDYGRDITDRLNWQKDLHLKLASTVPMPRVIDSFKTNEDSYLILEYIKGRSLSSCIQSSNAECQPWFELHSDQQQRITNYIIQIIDILSRFHEEGIVHRDITPVNFLVDKRNKIFIIDNELAFSIFDHYPLPAFEAGTHGFMSPQQVEQQLPTLKEDIYGLGATILTLLTGISPLTFDASRSEELRKGLSFFLEDQKLAHLIANCLSYDPMSRPELKAIRKSISEYKTTIARKKENKCTFQRVNTDLLTEVITGALQGLATSPTAIQNMLFYSRTSENDMGFEKEKSEFVKYPGLSIGIAGPLYLLAKAHVAGYDVSSLQNIYDTNFQYLKLSYKNSFPNTTPGLYSGAAGMAVAMLKGLNAGLISEEKDNLDFLLTCLRHAPVGLDISSGLAGQWLALLQCKKYISPEDFVEGQKSHVDILINYRKADGSWISRPDDTDKRQLTLGFSDGDTGIIWTLLKSLPTHDHQITKKMALDGIAGMKKSTLKLKKILQSTPFRELSIQNPSIIRAVFGHILVYLKAYELTKENKYKDFAESLLRELPTSPLIDNLSQNNGLAGFGELYLEAFKVTGNPIWQASADWIANALIHFSYRGAGCSRYWLGNNSKHCTADLMTGNAGLIHFLMRYQQPEKIQYPMLE